MRSFKCILLSAAGAIASSALAAHAALLTIDIASEAGATPGRVVVSGTGSAASSTIEFQDATDGFDFMIVGSSDASLVGLKGNIGGIFNLVAVNVVGSGQTSDTTGSGTFSIFDGSTALTADLSLIDVGTLGTGLALNASGKRNLSNFAYSGANPTLQGLATSPDATVVLSAQFLPAKSLTTLISPGAVTASVYSGTLAATVPEPSGYLVLAAGLVAAAVSVRRRSID